MQVDALDPVGPLGELFLWGREGASACDGRAPRQAPSSGRSRSFPRSSAAPSHLDVQFERLGRGERGGGRPRARARGCQRRRPGGPRERPARRLAAAPDQTIAHGRSGGPRGAPLPPPPSPTIAIGARRGGAGGRGGARGRPVARRRSRWWAGVRGALQVGAAHSTPTPAASPPADQAAPHRNPRRRMTDLEPIQPSLGAFGEERGEEEGGGRRGRGGARRPFSRPRPPPRRHSMVGARCLGGGARGRAQRAPAGDAARRRRAPRPQRAPARPVARRGAIVRLAPRLARRPARAAGAPARAPPRLAGGARRAPRRTPLPLAGLPNGLRRRQDRWADWDGAPAPPHAHAASLLDADPASLPPFRRVCGR
jgi:hypothetical protein